MKVYHKFSLLASAESEWPIPPTLFSEIIHLLILVPTFFHCKAMLCVLFLSNSNTKDPDTSEASE